MDRTPREKAGAAPLSTELAAATAGLASLKELAGDGAYHSLGFRSAAEVDEASLGTPLPVEVIGYDDLVTLSPTAEPEATLQNIEQVLYPVLAGDGVRSAVIVQQGDDGNWRVVSVGDASVVKLLEEARSIHADASGTEFDYTLVKVPALFQMFLAYSGTDGQMILATGGTDITQCAEANHNFNRNDCCYDPSRCVKGGWPEYDDYGHDFSYTDWYKALSFEQLRAEIDAGRPVGFAWGWNSGGGHYMVANGYKIDSAGTRWVWITDPWPVNTGANRYVTYAEFVAGSDHVTWTNDYGFTAPSCENDGVRQSDGTCQCAYGWSGLNCSVVNPGFVDIDERFSLNAQPDYLETTGVALTWTDGGVLFTGTNANGPGTGRGYVRTVANDYFTKNFVAEITVYVTGGSGGIVFFGMGSAIPYTAYYNEPATGPHIYGELLPDGIHPERVIVNDSRSGLTTYNVGKGDGFHRMRLTYDKDAKTVTFSVDFYSNSLDFVPDFTSRAFDVSDDGFDATNAHIFFGGGDNAFFDNFNVWVK